MGVWGLLISLRYCEIKKVVIFVVMSAQDVIIRQKRAEREEKIRSLPDVPKVEISDKEKADFTTSLVRVRVCCNV